MAFNGTLSLSLPSKHTMTFEWSSSQSGMASSVTWELKWTNVPARVSVGLQLDVVINGERKHYNVSRGSNATSNFIASGWVDLIRSTETNTADLNISLICTEGSYNNYNDESDYGEFGNLSSSKSWTIGTRTQYGSGAQLQSVTWDNDEQNPVITYTYDKGVTVDESTLQACISFTGATDNIPYRVIGNSGTYTFVLTDAEKQTLWTLLQDGTTATVRFYIKTTEVIDGEIMNIENYVSKTFNFVNYTPVLSPTIVDTNPATIALTGDANKLIRYMSTASYNMNAQPRKGGLEIIGCYIQNGGVIQEGFETGVFENPTSNTFYFSATDDRGYTGTASYSLDMFWGDFVSYVKLTAALRCSSITADGKLDITISGKYFDGWFSNNNPNAMTLQYAVTPLGSSASWVNVGTITPTVDGVDYTYTFSVEGLDYLKQYQVAIIIADRLMSLNATTQAVARPLFYWGSNEFHFNVPVTFEEDIIINGQSLIEILRNGGLIS